MKLFPFCKNQIELKISKDEFIQNLKTLTASNLDNFDDSTYSKSPKEYARESFETYFILWRIPRFSYSSELNFIYTTIHCRFNETKEFIYLKYYIRYNVYSYILMLILGVVSFIFVYDIVKNQTTINYSILLFIGGWYPFALFLFNASVKDDKKFIEKLSSKKT